MKITLVLLIFFLFGCQTPTKIFDDKNQILNIFNYNTHSLLNIPKKVETVEKNIRTPKLIPEEVAVEDLEKKIHSMYKKKSKKFEDFDLKKLIRKTDVFIITNLGQPNRIVEHGVTSNHQYYLKNCHVDLFFIRNNNELVLDHFEFRPVKLNSSLVEEICKKDLDNLKKIITN